MAGKKSFGEWLSYLLVGIVQGAVWLSETVPLTALIALPAGLIYALTDVKNHIDSSWLASIAIFMLIDGYFGHRHAEQKEQQMMQDFYRWHEAEMEKSKEHKTQ